MAVFLGTIGFDAVHGVVNHMPNKRAPDEKFPRPFGGHT
jgi:hypothetical protein